MQELIECGLDGIEVYNPHNKGDTLKWYLDICQEFDLIPTVGTDYHGRKEDTIEIDKNLCISDESIIERIKKKKSVIKRSNKTVK